MAKNGKSNESGTEVAVVDHGSAMVPFDPNRFIAGAANMQKAGAARADFLRMDKSGEWFYGQDDNPVHPNDLLYIDPMGSVHGWQCWADTDIPGVQPELIDTIKAPHYDPMPERPAAVPERGREWAEMYGISAIMNGNKLVYTTTSMGGKDALANLYGAIMAQFAENPNHMVAIVKLTNDWYKHKKYGKTFVPVFEVVGWTDKPPVGTGAPAPKAARKTAAPAPVAAKKAPAKTARRSA